MIDKSLINKCEEKLSNVFKSLEEIARDTERDNFMTAKQALEYGLIDKILTRRP